MILRFIATFIIGACAGQTLGIVLGTAVTVLCVLILDGTINRE